MFHIVVVIQSHGVLSFNVVGILAVPIFVINFGTNILLTITFNKNSI